MAARKHLEPEANWEIYDIRIKHTAVISNDIYVFIICIFQNNMINLLWQLQQALCFPVNVIV
jgi:hypothetical protein